MQTKTIPEDQHPARSQPSAVAPPPIRSIKEAVDEYLKLMREVCRETMRKYPRPF